MIRRRPIPRTGYRWKRDPKPENSLRYTTVLDGAVRVYPDGREVCQDNPQGRKEYQRRIEVMCIRQNWVCCLCPDKLRSIYDATFEHQRRRGMGAAFRDDRIEKDGKDWNGAAHWICNVEKG